MPLVSLANHKESCQTQRLRATQTIARVLPPTHNPTVNDWIHQILEGSLLQIDFTLEEMRLRILQVHLRIQLIVLDFNMLIQRTLRPIGTLTSLHRTPIVPLNFICCPSETLLTVIISALPILDILGLAL